MIHQSHRMSTMTQRCDRCGMWRGDVMIGLQCTPAEPVADRPCDTEEPAAEIDWSAITKGVSST